MQTPAEFTREHLSEIVPDYLVYKGGMGIINKGRFSELVGLCVPFKGAYLAARYAAEIVAEAMLECNMALRARVPDCHALLRDSEKMVDVSCSPSANIEHLQNVLVVYRDYIRNRSTRSDFSPDGARDTSWKLGRDLARLDLGEVEK